MKYPWLEVPRFDQYSCEKPIKESHSLAHAKIGSTVMEQTPKGMHKYPENNVKRSMPMLAWDDVAPMMDHVHIAFFSSRIC